MRSYLITIAVAATAAAIALVLTIVVHRMVRRFGQNSTLLAELSQHSHRPFQVAVTIVAVQFAVRGSTGYAVGTAWRQALLHTLVLAVIAATGWLLASLLLVTEDVALAQFRTDVPDNRDARRIKTQVVMLRRVTIVVVVVLAVGVMLMTFPSVRGVGASVLASAGVIGVVAALAAQSLLGNVFAGLQLAFSDAVRLDDVVVVEGEWGRIEELTLSYVVVHIWDDRRLILPTSYFTSTPFQNWTRTQSALLGTAELDVDWSVPVQAMREELRRLVEGTELWDGRVCVLQVTGATGGLVRVRALVSAAAAGSLWDLRCLVREHLIAWIREHRPVALPRMRAELGDAGGWQRLDLSLAADGLPGRRDGNHDRAERDGRDGHRGPVEPDRRDDRHVRDQRDRHDDRDVRDRDGRDRRDGHHGSHGGGDRRRDPVPDRRRSADDAGGAGERTGSGQRRDGELPDDAQVFGGSDDGQARSSVFVGPDDPANPAR